MIEIKSAYEYRAEVLRWVDGDTVDLKVDLGFHMSMATRFRLFGIDTPEHGKPLAAEATAHSSESAPAGSIVSIVTEKSADKYGRWLARISTETGQCINDTLLHLGLAKEYYGGTKDAG